MSAEKEQSERIYRDICRKRGGRRDLFQFSENTQHHWPTSKKAHIHKVGIEQVEGQYHLM